MTNAYAVATSNSARKAVRIYYALGMMSVGVLALVYGYAVLAADKPPSWLPWPNGLGYAAGILMLATGAGLLFERSSRISIRILLPFLLLWTLTRVPIPLMDPGREIAWFLVGEIAVPAAGALVLFAWYADLRPGSKLEALTREYAIPLARILIGLSVPTFGLSHFFEFAARTVSLVPAWLPFPKFWADAMGAAQFLAGLGVLFSIYPRLSAAAEGAMLSVFALLVWVPAVITKPKLTSNWAEFLFTVALAAACLVVALGLPARKTAVPGVPASGVGRRAAVDAS